MVQLTNGERTSWLVASATGRCIGSYEDEAFAREFVEKRAAQGVPVRLFCVTTNMVEHEHP